MGVPKDYEEAAQLNQANAFQIYSRIFMPILPAAAYPGGGIESADGLE